MKARLLALFSVLLLVGCGESSSSLEPIDLNDAQILGKIIDEAIEGEESEMESGYTGWAKEIYENGRIKVLKQFKGGKVEAATQWYRNGQKKSEVIVKDRKIISGVVWKPNGEKCQKTKLKDGNGVMFMYFDDGTSFGSVSFKNGEYVED